jgi:hypothetical protein
VNDRIIDIKLAALGLRSAPGRPTAKPAAVAAAVHDPGSISTGEIIAAYLRAKTQGAATMPESDQTGFKSKDETLAHIRTYYGNIPGVTDVQPSQATREANELQAGLDYIAAWEPGKDTGFGSQEETIEHIRKYYGHVAGVTDR